MTLLTDRTIIDRQIDTQVKPPAPFTRPIAEGVDQTGASVKPTAGARPELTPHTPRGMQQTETTLTPSVVV